MEIGRGVGGDSFLDLTGTDPDTAANLVALMLVNDLSDLEALGGAEVVLTSGAQAVALGVSLDGGPQMILPANTAPDRRYLWLDRVGDGPLTLEAGAHVLHVSYAGTEPGRRAVIDGFLVQPVVARRVFAGPDGARLVLIVDTRTGGITVQEG